jgi:hypothetical protein
MRLLWCHLEVELRQPFGPHAKQPFCVLLQAEGTPPVIRIAAPQGFSPTAWLHDFFQPAVQGIVQRDIGEDGRDYTPYKVANLLLEFSTSIPRTQLRPSYGEGFLGAPLQRGTRWAPIPLGQGGDREPSRTPSPSTTGDSQHV